MTGCICTSSGFTGHSLTSTFWTYVKTVKPEWADLRIRNFLVRVKSPFPDPERKPWVPDPQQCNWQLHCFSTAGASMFQIRLVQKQYLFWQLMHLVQLNCNGLLPTNSAWNSLPMDNQLLQHDIFYCWLPACLSVQTVGHTLCNCMAFPLCELFYDDKGRCYVKTICHTLCNCMAFHLYELLYADQGCSFVQKDLPHTVQLYGFPPVWTLECWSRVFFCEKDLPHNVQLYGF
jgi:hypothetical protein